MLAPCGPASDLVITSGGGLTADPEDVQAIAAALNLLFDEWRGGRERVACDAALAGLTRRETARAVAAALDSARAEHR